MKGFTIEISSMTKSTEFFLGIVDVGYSCDQSCQ